MYQKVLVPLDGSEVAECVLPHVTAVVNGCGIPEIWLLRVVEPFPVTEALSQQLVEAHEARLREAREYLEEVASRLAREGVTATINKEVAQGTPEEQIVDFARDHGIDLIAMSTHGRSGISRWVYGSVADKVLRAAGVPVLLVRAGQPKERA